MFCSSSETIHDTIQLPADKEMAQNTLAKYCAVEWIDSKNAINYGRIHEVQTWPHYEKYVHV